jgi:hypothetical protein
MATEIVEIAGIETSQKVKTEIESPAAKSRKSNECEVCSVKTYQKDGMCVLCKTGITQAYGELKKLLSINNKQG